MRWTDTPNPFAMTADELDSFMNERWFASVASLRQDGSPVIVYVGYEWDGTSVYFSVRSTRLLVKRLKRDPRASFAITNIGYPPRFVSMQGTAEVIDDPGFARTRSIQLRYMDADSPVMNDDELDQDAFWQVYTKVGRTMFKFTPHTIVSEDAGKDDYARGGGGEVSDRYAQMRGEIPG